ncbi:MAG: D-2-hydroxyacid dehydrogenase [Lachnospiraceae bacterium]|nr:D-2-hydroxyacid dehydrogenase [Lachnospiraceae bacterium]
MKIVILERGTIGPDVDVNVIAELGETVIYDNTEPEQVAERVKDAEIIVANKCPLNEQTLKDAPKVRFIEEFATGYDNIDLEYCRNRDIGVANVSDYSTPAVVQHTFALALYLLEHLPHYDQYVKQGDYAVQSRFTYFGVPFTELAGKTWGIVGMGHIGQGVAAVAKAFGCDVIWYSISGAHAVEGYRQVDLATLLRESDFLSLHCPLNEKTHHLINAEALQQMKPTAVLINVARGKVVDNAALAKALQNNEIAAAGLDVVEAEPITTDNPLMSIQDSNRLIITPHMAWASVEARNRVVTEAYKNIEAFLRGEKRNRV